MLSVIIPSRNRAAFLGNALRSLVNQTLPRSDFEVIVVDNGSTDGTPGVVAECERILHGIRYFRDDRPGLHVGRHRGLKEARGDILVYADDDIRALPTWLASIQDCFRDPGVALVGGNNIPEFEGTPPAWLSALWQEVREDIQGRAIPALSVMHLAEGRRTISPFYVWGCNFSIRRSVLEEAGGFHPDGVPQDLIRFRGDGETHVAEFVLREGLTCLFDSNASVYHAVTAERMTVEYFRRRAFNQGVSDSYTLLRRSGGRLSPAILRAQLGAVARCSNAWIREKLGRHDELAVSVARGHGEGFWFHQRAYRADPELRSWVHRSNYLELES